MRTWNDYKNHARTVDSEGRLIIEEIEKTADIISIIISKRSEIGVSQSILTKRRHA